MVLAIQAVRGLLQSCNVVIGIDLVGGMLFDFLAYLSRHFSQAAAIQRGEVVGIVKASNPKIKGGASRLRQCLSSWCG